MGDIIGRKVEHIDYGWTGTIGFGSTEDEFMVIWEHSISQRGASLCEPEKLRWVDEVGPDA